MMAAHFKNLMAQWGVMHWVRLAIGAFLLAQGFAKSDQIAAFLGSIVLLQLLTNTGCWGSAGCDLANPDDRQKTMHSDKK
jgi:hypothetical protein